MKIFGVGNLGIGSMKFRKRDWDHKREVSYSSGRLGYLFHVLFDHAHDRSLWRRTRSCAQSYEGSTGVEAVQDQQAVK